MGSDQITVTAGAVNGDVHTIDGGAGNDILTGSSGDILTVVQKIMVRIQSPQQVATTPSIAVLVMI